MKILLTIHHLQNGGAQRQVLELARLLTQRGHLVKVAVLEDEQSTEVKSGYREAYSDVEVLSCERELVTQSVFIWLSRKKLGQRLLRSSKEATPRGGYPRRIVFRFRDFLFRLISAMFRFAAGFLLGPLLLISAEISNKFLLLRLMVQEPSILLHSLSLRSLTRREEFDLAVSFLSKTNCVTLTAFLQSSTPVVVSERNNYALQDHKQSLRRFRGLVYPKAFLITANTQFALADIQKDFPSSNVRWLPNSYAYRGRPRKRERLVSKACVVSRLEPQKNIDRTIEAFSLEPLQSQEITLDVIGAGADKKRLQEIVLERRLGDRVSFPGYIYQDNIPWKQYGFIVINGPGEGSSNALHEAVSNGLLPLIANAVREPWEDILSEEIRALVGTDGSPRQISAKLDFLLNDSRYAISLAQEIQRQFEAYWAKSARELHKIVEELETGVVSQVGQEEVQ